MLVLSIAEYLHELFQDCGVTAMATLGELRGVMVMAVYFTFMLII